MISMTGYGTVEGHFQGKRITINISSVNRKHSDFRFSIPRDLFFMESDLRSALSDFVQRGAVNVSIELSDDDSKDAEVHYNNALIKASWESLTKLAKELGTNEPTMNDLLQIPDLFNPMPPDFNSDELKNKIFDLYKEALNELIETRKVEGGRIKVDLEERRQNLIHFLSEIVKQAPQVSVNYREKLIQRINAIDEELGMDEEKILKEIMFFVERSDITEETTRLASHIEQMHILFNTKGPIGRKLDFLIQELVREINTIGSKANDKDIAHFVVEFKTELERIREQVQNIE